MTVPPDHLVSGRHPHLHMRRATEALKDHHESARQQNAQLAMERAAAAQNGAQAPLTPDEGPTGAG